MAEQTTSSIVIDAEPAAIMEVIGDFPAYPHWATGVKTTHVRRETDGWADEVYFVLDVPPIRDEYTLVYDWDGYDEVSWTLTEGVHFALENNALVMKLGIETALEAQP